MRGMALTVSAFGLVLLGLWIVVPAPVRVLLPLSVVMPELSAWLGLAALGVGTAAIVKRRWTAAGAAAAALVLAALPLSRVPGTAREIDRRLQTSLGNDYLDRVPLSLRGALRPSAVSIRELFVGMWPPPGRPVHGLEIATVGGVRLTADVYPSPFPDAPLIVQIYGGSWQRGGPGDDERIARYLASRGYLVVAIDYRHAPRWHWGDLVADVRLGITWAKDHAREYGGDRFRTALLGRSAGGHLALMAAYAPGGPEVQAVVSFYGPTDLERGYAEPPRPDPIGVRAVLEALVGGPPSDRVTAYREASPISYAARPLPPTLQVTGSRDHVVVPRFARTLDERLRAAGNQSVLIELPWAEHAFDAVTFGPGAQLAVYGAERFLAWALSRG